MTRLETIQAEMTTLLKQDREYNQGVNEGGEGYERVNPKIEELRIAATAELEKEFAAEWTLDVLTARRAAWNAGIRAAATKNGVSTGAVVALAKKLGYSGEDVAKAKKLHGIK